MKKFIPAALVIIALIVIVGYYMDRRGDTETSDDTAAVMQDSAVTDAAQVATKMVGTWQATDDAKAVVTFNADGTTVDTYDGEELGMGTWEVTLGSGEDYAHTGILLKTVVAGEEYNYLVFTVDDTQLVLNYTDRGNTLSYTRIAETTVPATSN